MFLLRNQHLCPQIIRLRIWFNDRCSPHPPNNTAVHLIYRLMRLATGTCLPEQLKQNLAQLAQLENFSHEQLVKRHEHGISWSYALEIMERQSERPERLER